MSLIEIAPNRWVVARVRLEPARSDLSVPFVISDEMPPTEQVDGRHLHLQGRSFARSGARTG